MSAAIAALAMPAALRFVFALVAKVDQGVVLLGRAQDDVPATASVAAARSAARHELLTPKRNTPVAAFTGLDVDDGFIDEHGGIGEGKAKRRTLARLPILTCTLPSGRLRKEPS